MAGPIWIRTIVVIVVCIMVLRRLPGWAVPLGPGGGLGGCGGCGGSEDEGRRWATAWRRIRAGNFQDRAGVRSRAASSTGRVRELTGAG